MDEEKPADEKNLGENNVLIDRFFRGTQYRVTTDRTPLPTLPTPYYTNVHRWIFQPSHRRGRYVRVEDRSPHNQSCHSDWIMPFVNKSLDNNAWGRQYHQHHHRSQLERWIFYFGWSLRQLAVLFLPDGTRDDLRKTRAG